MGSRLGVGWMAVVIGACADSGPAVGEHSAAVLASPALLYEEPFDSCEADWTAQGVGSTWQCGHPLAEPAGDADGSGLAWATALDGAYGRHEESTLTSPIVPLSPQTEGGG